MAFVSFAFRETDKKVESESASFPFRVSASFRLFLRGENY